VIREELRLRAARAQWLKSIEPQIQESSGFAANAYCGANNRLEQRLPFSASEFSQGRTPTGPVQFLVHNGGSDG
jgi:hypothetical protein